MMLVNYVIMVCVCCLQIILSMQLIDVLSHVYCSILCVVRFKCCFLYIIVYCYLLKQWTLLFFVTNDIYMHCRYSMHSYCELCIVSDEFI